MFYTFNIHILTLIYYNQSLYKQEVGVIKGTPKCLTLEKCQHNMTFAECKSSETMDAISSL